MISPKKISPLIILPIILGLVFLYFRYIERQAIYYPGHNIAAYPDKLGLDFEDVYFETSDAVKLNGWFIPARGSRYTILLCHGNAGNMSRRIRKAVLFNKLGCDVFMFDYRGYGKSGGSPSEKGLYEDARAAYRYLLKRGVAADRMIGYGESLGGAVVIDLAGGNRLRGLILESAFSNARDMAGVYYPYIPSWAIDSKFDSMEKIKLIKIPKLIIHSVNDSIVPFRFAEKLYKVASEPKTFLRVRGEHNVCFYESEDAIRESVLRSFEIK